MFITSYFPFYVHLKFAKSTTVGSKSKTGSLFQCSKRKRKIGRLGEKKKCEREEMAVENHIAFEVTTNIYSLLKTMR